MTKPPRRLMSVPVQINQYVGGKPSTRAASPFLFMYVFLWRWKNITDVLIIKEPPKRLFLTSCYDASTALRSAQRGLHIECPFARPHNGLARAIFPDAVDIHLRRADHE